MRACRLRRVGVVGSCPVLPARSGEEKQQVADVQYERESQESEGWGRRSLVTGEVLLSIKWQDEASGRGDRHMVDPGTSAAALGGEHSNLAARGLITVMVHQDATP